MVDLSPIWSNVGTEAATRAAPDGNTLLMVVNPFLIEPHVRTVSYDPFNNFEPGCFLVKTLSILVAQSVSPTAAWLICWMRLGPSPALCEPTSTMPRERRVRQRAMLPPIKRLPVFRPLPKYRSGPIR
jgi:hypothetical protein